MNPLNPTFSILFPASPDDALAALAALQNRQSVILNLQNLTPPDAQRFLDWMAGGACAIDAYPVWLGEQVYLFVPPSVRAEAPAHLRPAFAPKLAS